MRSVRRRRLLGGAVAAAAAAVAAGPLRLALAQAEPRVIDVVAKRFTFEPNEIALRVGERVVVAIRALDFAHGFNIPELGRRFDLMPGRVTRVELQPQQPGVIDFLCDNFCGDGHEEMHGRFVVGQ
jgi:cytochrome c oxidase subunit II